MKTDRLLMLTVVLLISSIAAMAAPVDSIESGQAGGARQKINAYLGEQAVAQQLTALGLTRTQVDEQLARLSDSQLEQVAAQIDLLRAGGDIQGGNPNPYGPLECIFAPLGRLLYNIYQLVFCWGTLQ